MVTPLKCFAKYVSTFPSAWLLDAFRAVEWLAQPQYPLGGQCVRQDVGLSHILPCCDRPGAVSTSRVNRARDFATQK